MQNQLIQRLLFQLKVHENCGNSFQDFFTKIMKEACEDFELVKPQGAIGDRKNDGFRKAVGIYYQVYSPEDPQQKISEAIKKLKDDFQGLFEFWNNIHPIKEFYFVFNDKYRGSYPLFYSTLNELRLQYVDIKFDIFTVNELEKIFVGLSEVSKGLIIGFTPTVDEYIQSLNYPALEAVVKYLLEQRNDGGLTGSLVAPDFMEKIKFNSLGHEASSLLISANYQTQTLEEFFKSDPEQRLLLRDIFSNIYQLSKENDKGKPLKNSDDVFMDIVRYACPSNSQPIQNAVIILMSYYFESCDIFEQPT